jgi:hypothetical protein
MKHGRNIKGDIAVTPMGSLFSRKQGGRSSVTTAVRNTKGATAEYTVTVKSTRDRSEQNIRCACATNTSTTSTSGAGQGGGQQARAQ